MGNASRKPPIVRWAASAAAASAAVWPIGPIKGGVCSVGPVDDPVGPGNSLCTAAGKAVGIQLACTGGPCSSTTSVRWADDADSAPLPDVVQQAIGSRVTPAGSLLAGVDISILSGGAPATCGQACATGAVAGIKRLFDAAGVTSVQVMADRCAGGGPGLTAAVDVWKGYDLADLWSTLELAAAIAVPIYLGTSDVEGAVIVAGMMGNFFVEAYNMQVCDESDWGNNCLNGVCPCGQFGHDYTNGDGYTVPPLCAANANMSIDAAANGNNAKWAQGQMQCTPGTPSSGCCWWGRGPTQLTGRHNIKVLDDWLVANAATLGTTPAPLCGDPGAICRPASKTSTGASVVWLSSIGYWIWSVQANENYMPQLARYMAGLAGGQFPSQQTTDLVSSTPATWPSGIGGAINNSVWSNDAQGNADRVCGFLRMLRLLGLMPAEPGGTSAAAACNVNSVA
jgi:hypothetical protein